MICAGGQAAEPPRREKGRKKSRGEAEEGPSPEPGAGGIGPRLAGAAPGDAPRPGAMLCPSPPPPAGLPHTYVPLVVHLVVGELHAVEADDLPHPGLPRAGGVGVDVEARGDAGVVRVPRHHPLRAVIDVPGPGRAPSAGGSPSPPVPTPYRFYRCVRAPPAPPCEPRVPLGAGGSQLAASTGAPRGSGGSRPVSPVPVSFGVHGHDVDSDVILLQRLQPLHLHPDGREHPPAGTGAAAERELPLTGRKEAAELGTGIGREENRTQRK